jgi:chromosome segregation ATPase
LAAHIETAKAATETIFKHLSYQQASQKTQLTQLAALNQSFRSSESSLQAESRRLKQEWESIHKRTEELEKIQTDLSKTEAHLSQKKQDLQEQYLRLQEMEKTIQEASSRLVPTPSAPHGSMDTTRETAAEVLAKTILDRQSQLKVIESKIREKLAELQKVKVELDQTKKP